MLKVNIESNVTKCEDDLELKLIKHKLYDDLQYFLVLKHVFKNSIMDFVTKINVFKNCKRKTKN